MSTRHCRFLILCFCACVGWAIAQEAPVYRRVEIEAPAQRRRAAQSGLEAGWAAPRPSQGVLPLGIGLLPPVQFPAEDWDLAGLRLNILAGMHNNVAFLDFAVLANIAHGEVSGLELAGVWNLVKQDFRGLQLSGVANRVHGDVTALQLAGIANINGAGDFVGLQIAAVNVNQGDGSGLQVGLFNQAESMSGAQIGLVNKSRDLQGLQLGLFNFISNSTLPFMVFLNLGL
jgi:hypothetical protein